jgi:hypothetical protein
MDDLEQGERLDPCGGRSDARVCCTCAEEVRGEDGGKAGLDVGCDGGGLGEEVGGAVEVRDLSEEVGEGGGGSSLCLGVLRGRRGEGGRDEEVVEERDEDVGPT